MKITGSDAQIGRLATERSHRVTVGIDRCRCVAISLHFCHDSIEAAIIVSHLSSYDS